MEHKFHFLILWFCTLMYFTFLLIQLITVKKKSLFCFYPIKNYVS